MAIKAILFDFYGVLYVPRKLGFTWRLVLNKALLDFSQTLRPDYKIGLLTNMGAGIVDKYFTQADLDNYFDNVIISGDVAMTKPQPEIYELAAKLMKFEPGECVLVDDTEVNCEGAVAAGMKAVLYNSIEQAKRDLVELFAEN
jgi:HAD superfamily hydrolase (TIGR01509 family)